ALRGERLRGEILEYVEDLAADWYEKFQPNNEYDQFVSSMRSNLLCEPNITQEEFKTIKENDFIKRVLETATEFYDKKEELLGTEFISKLEQIAILQTIDDKWRDHLRLMDDLKEGIHLRSYGQKDPLLEYKQEAYKLFLDLIVDINKAVVNFAFKYSPRMVVDQVAAKQKARANHKMPDMRRTSISGGNFTYQHSNTTLPTFLSMPVKAKGPEMNDNIGRTERREQPKIGRNDLCPCGSGKKYKNCCGRDLNNN
ncbi:MAG: SEC-C domain-containing protein, partial [Bacteroidetes bacterium]|nr:SEC-C domain-containing protein [Bacteroidota bacterium]